MDDVETISATENEGAVRTFTGRPGGKLFALQAVTGIVPMGLAGPRIEHGDAAVGRAQPKLSLVIFQDGVNPVP